MSINCKPIFTTISGSGLFIIPEGFNADVMICEGVNSLLINNTSMIGANGSIPSNPSMENIALKEEDTIEGGVYVLTLYQMG